MGRLNPQRRWHVPFLHFQEGKAQPGGLVVLDVLSGAPQPCPLGLLSELVLWGGGEAVGRRGKGENNTTSCWKTPSLTREAESTDLGPQGHHRHLSLHQHPASLATSMPLAFQCVPGTAPGIIHILA